VLEMNVSRLDYEHRPLQLRALSFEKFAAKVCLIAINESWLPPAARSYDYDAAEHVDDKPRCRASCSSSCRTQQASQRQGIIFSG